MLNLCQFACCVNIVYISLYLAICCICLFYGMSTFPFSYLFSVRNKNNKWGARVDVADCVMAADI